jgi:hypothetical protein
VAQITPSPENAAQLASLAVQLTKDITSIDLDYSAGSLEHVDQLILGFRKEGHSIQSMEHTIISFGCYLGEVIIKNLGGQWKRANSTSMKEFAEEHVLLLEASSGWTLNPIGKAFKLLQNGPEDSLVFYYGVVTSQGRLSLAEDDRSGR